MNRIRLGTRSSKLAMVQTEQVRDALVKSFPNLEVEIIAIETKGDKNLNTPIYKIQGKGAFTEELEHLLREEKVDYAVHSLKDLPSDLPEDLPLVACLPRKNPKDALVVKEGLSLEAFEALDQKKIGTSSIRRSIQILDIYPNSQILDIRGNVQTRLRKLEEGDYDAIILAAAGLERLGLEDRARKFFEVEEMVPSCGQGIIGIQGKSGRDHDKILAISDKQAMAEAEIERSYLNEISGGCSSPSCAHAIMDGEDVEIHAYYVDMKKGVHQITRKVPKDQALESVKIMVEEAKSKYGDSFIRK